MTREQVQAFLEANPRFASSLHKAPHVYAGNGADLVAEVAPYINESRSARLKQRLSGGAAATAKAIEQSPGKVLGLVRSAAQTAPSLAARVKEDIAIYREIQKNKKAELRATAQN